jgi:hypothetical protein
MVRLRRQLLIGERFIYSTGPHANDAAPAPIADWRRFIYSTDPHVNDAAPDLIVKSRKF